MDALCQGIESYWSIHSTDESRQLARGAIELAWNWIESAVIDHDPEALEHMAEASHLAGRAINITKTTAPHAVSYPMTSHFGITHGHAVALLTARYMRYNADVTEVDCLDARGSKFVTSRLNEITAFLNADSLDHAVDNFIAKLRAIKLETSLCRLGISSEQDKRIVVNYGMHASRLKNNPRAVSIAGLENLLA